MENYYKCEGCENGPCVLKTKLKLDTIDNCLCRWVLKYHNWQPITKDEFLKDMR